MTKVVKSLQIPSSSITQTTETNYGVLYASASSIYFTNDSGQTFDLTKSTSYTNVIYFTGSADRTDITYQWSPSPGLQYLEVCAVGAGGGGGAGAAVNSVIQQGGCGGGAATGSNGGAGGSGSAGYIAILEFY
jgi:hypothetical protein